MTKLKHAGGRPTLYRREMCDRLVEAMAGGLTAEAAAARIGISARSLFAELERVAFAVEVHFGDHVAHQVREPLRGYNRIVVSTALQMELSSGFRPEGDHKADYDDPDRLSDEIYKAKVAVETALRPHLEAPTLEQFLLLTELRASARRVFAFLVSMGRRLCALS